ncbi:lysine--tRNA ligase [Candidatus Woesearchaeota archaeon]|nr:lysine--tRNA ligase [Candidatus Woesearchaeota archaeon]
MGKGKKKAESTHWADRAAEQIIRVKGNKKKYVVAAGITPSGTIHVGNFREIITQELVKRGLEKKGKTVRFIYSWDDFDVFRKVPKNLPKKQELLKSLRKPISEVPDPFGCHESYARHHEAEIEEDVPKLGIDAEFLYQHKLYKKGIYNKLIKEALENTQQIKEILNKFRKEDLPESWLPIMVYCPECRREVTNVKYFGGYDIEYECECGSKEKIDFDKEKGSVKLKWRACWPMRWHYYKEDFESAGKDHFAAGGSIVTSRLIQKEVYGTEPPFGFAYEWIAIKGGGEFASSLGKVITLKEMLAIYEPEIIRYLFASTRPNVGFKISFDVDVIKIYEDFDKCERIYFDKVDVSEKEKAKQSRIYELSCVSKTPSKLPYQPGFRHLTTVLQIKELDVDRTVDFFEKELKTKFDKERLRTRVKCVKNWLEKHAPEAFKFSVQDGMKVKLGAKEKKVLQFLGKRLKKKDWQAESLHEEIYKLCQDNELEIKSFFNAAYKVLIGKEKGPRLASFILEIGKNRVAQILEQIK